jgi:hypothetical protein
VSNGEDDQLLVVGLTVTVTPGPTGDVTRYIITRSIGVLKPDVPPADVGVQSAVGACPEDGSLSVQVCGTIIYDAYKERDGFRYASMSKVVNQAIRNDFQARLTILTFDIGATGRCGQGCSGQPHHEFAGHIDQPVSGQAYPQNVPWYGQYQRVSQSPLDLMGLRQDLTWARGAGVYHLPNSIDVPPDLAMLDMGSTTQLSHLSKME